MARSRTIKPGLWLNEELAEVSIPARYLFPALWCHADKDGRLEYRPKKLKAEVYPYDDQDVEFLIAELHGKKFISVYENEGKQYIQIANFAKHQNPHPKEKSEKLPPPVNICNYDSNLKKFIFTASNVILPFPSFPSSSLDTSTGRTKTEIEFLSVLAEKEGLLRSLFPQHDFVIVAEGVLAHWRNLPPPIDPYDKIYKWFQSQQVKQPEFRRANGSHDTIPAHKREDFTDPLTREFLGV